MKLNIVCRHDTLPDVGEHNVAEVEWYWTQEEILPSLLKKCTKTYGTVQSNEVFLNGDRNVHREIDPETVLCRCNVSMLKQLHRKVLYCIEKNYKGL